MALTVLRRRSAMIPAAATAAQTLPDTIALLLKTHVGGSAVGTVSASLDVADAATSTATPHNPTDALTLTAAAVADEIVEAEYVAPGDIPAWQ